MFVLGALCLIIGAATPGFTAPPVVATAADTVPVVDSAAMQMAAEASDTIPRRRPRVVEVSEWYSRRLTIHRYVAYGTVPVFAAQWAAGNAIFPDPRNAPAWAKTTHRTGATLLAGMFTVNTVTGLWNLWDSRSTEQGRVLRTIHALTMLGADAAFTYAGVKLSDEAEQSSAKRREHRTVALSAMGVTFVSGLAMKLWNH